MSYPFQGPFAVLTALVLALPVASQEQASQQASGKLRSTGSGGTTSRRLPELWISGFTSNRVHRYQTITGLPLGDLAIVRGAQSIHVGSDGYTYVCAENANSIFRYKGDVPLGAFVFDDPDTTKDETGGLTNPTAAVLGPDGDLYVASFDGDQVLRYDGRTGDFQGVFVEAGSAGLDEPDAGMVFGPDGLLWIPSFGSSEILRYDGETGDFVDVFASPGEGGLNAPRVIRFGPDGLVYVSSWRSNRILRFDLDGNFVDRFIVLNRPSGFDFDPSTGDVLAVSDQVARVLRFDGTTGARIGTFLPTGSGGLRGATYIEILLP